MQATSNNSGSHTFSILAVLLILTAGLAYVAVILPFSSALDGSPIKVGNVAGQDIVAPSVLSFESKLQTEARREMAYLDVSPIYSTPDTSVARQQAERLRSALSWITAVRSDQFANEQQKLTDLKVMEFIHLNDETALSILGLNSSRWQAVQAEAVLVLEQVMRKNIRDDQLVDTRRTVPTLISLSLPKDQAEIVSELVVSFVAPNSFLNNEQTEAARIAARDAVEPVMHSYKAGETIIQRGQVIDPSVLEALDAYGLTNPGVVWQDMAGAAALVLIIMAFLVLYLSRMVSNRELNLSFRSLVLTCVLFLVFLFGARLIIPNHTVLPYLYPLAAYSLLISTLFGVRQALITSLPLVVLSTYGLPFSLEFTLYFLLSSMFGVLSLYHGKRISAFFWTGIVIAASGFIVIVAYRLPRPDTDWLGIATLAGASLANGIASVSVALILQHFLAQILGKVTALQLYELSRPDHPLLKQLLQLAPGTYQHSLQVANLVDHAAERIGADALLARVGALYHDIGKIENPAYFIENQILGSKNPHDNLEPEVSSAVIISHVYDGLSLAKRYRLPVRLRDFITQHHGASITRYQYNKAVNAAGGDESLVNTEQYTYPGPHPQSRETALLMLADTTEARMRAEQPKDEDELRYLIKNVIDHRISSGALQDCDITLSDLKKVEISFVETLRGYYHPRLQYPVQEPKEIPTQVPRKDKENQADIENGPFREAEKPALPAPQDLQTST